MSGVFTYVRVDPTQADLPAERKIKQRKKAPIEKKNYKTTSCVALCILIGKARISLLDFTNLKVISRNL